MMILALVGMSLAAYMAERRHQKAALRVAAIAFECQEGLLITDERSVILQANQSFLRTSGYALHEVLGRTPHFVLAPPDAAPEPRPPAPVVFAPAHNLQRREWHRRKSGELFPVWITLSPVRNHHARITHYVLTLTDITDLRHQEEQRRQMEQAHREALVQEVHHRIKNNLQGVMGMLRTLDQKHPRLHGPINQVIGQVHSIAVIHGLQGSTTADRVRLSDLICAIAGGIESLWNTPIHVDTPHWWKACYVVPAEAVPVALVLNELILNAVKHGGKAQQDVRIRLHDGLQADSVQITISNPGRRPDRAIVDMRMPGRSGLELAERLRDLDHIPFLMLSAYSDAQTVERAASLGALGYLVKPLDVAQIRPAVEAGLRRARELDELRQTRAQLQKALDGDRDINVATGITMVQYRLTRAAAFELLRSSSRSQRRKLAELAREVIQLCDTMHRDQKT